MTLPPKGMKRTPLEAGLYKYTCGPEIYLLERNADNRWFALVFDPDAGRVVDRRVPQTEFDTRREAEIALDRHVNHVALGTARMKFARVFGRPSKIYPHGRIAYFNIKPNDPALYRRYKIEQGSDPAAGNACWLIEERQGRKFAPLSLHGSIRTFPTAEVAAAALENHLADNDLARAVQ